MITGKRAKVLRNETWETLGAEGVQEAAGTKSERIYIEIRKATVAQLVELRPLFEVCTRETGHKERGAGGSCGSAKRQQKNNFGTA